MTTGSGQWSVVRRRAAACLAWCWRGVLAWGEALAQADLAEAEREDLLAPVVKAGGKPPGPRPGSRAALAGENARLARELNMERTLRWEMQRQGNAARSELRQYLELHGDVPGLTPGELERLALVAEQCGDVVHVVGKVLRHGWLSRSPYGGLVNRHALERELGGLRAVMGVMLDAGDVTLAEIQRCQRARRDALGRWTHYQVFSQPREGQVL